MVCRKCSRKLPEDAIYCCYCGIKQATGRQNSKAKGNGTGSIYKNASRSGWMVAWTVGTKVVTGKNGLPAVRTVRKTKSGFKTKKEANEFLSEVIAGKDAMKVKKVPTVEQMYSQYMNAPGKKISASTITAYKIAFNKRIKPNFGSLPINVVTLNHMEQAIEGLTYYPAKDVKALMSMLFRRAIVDGFAQANPTILLELPEKNSKEIPAWLPEEIESLWKAYGEGNRIAAACLLMIYTGMMTGELFTLKKDMIDEENHVITGCGLKTKERKEKPIVLSDTVLPVLSYLISTSVSDNGFVMGMSRSKFYQSFAQMKKDLSIREDVRPYSSRHSTATELELLGVSPSVIASVLRHKSYATTAKHYIDISTDKAIEAVGKIDRKPKGVKQ